MSDTAPQTSGSQLASKDQPPQNATDVVELKDMEANKTAQDQIEEGPSTAAGDDDATGETGPSSTSKAKGKEKVPAPAETEGDEDESFAIKPTNRTSSSSESPVCNITLLLPTGARHPYRIDEKYLTKRNVEIPDELPSGKRDPFSISIYKLKELILREWREDWESKPASPSSIRLIHFGKLLEDKEQLKKYQFSAESPNVVHMSVKPAELVEEEEGGKSKSSGRDGRTREGGGGCCVIL